MKISLVLAKHVDVMRAACIEETGFSCTDLTVKLKLTSELNFVNVLLLTV